MQRIESLTSDSGWLTLAGLFWLKDGDNSFGRDPDNSLVLDNPALAAHRRLLRRHRAPGALHRRPGGRQ